MEVKDNVLLEVNELKVTYRTDDGVVNAINGISFNVEKGSTLGIVGETGAGKTTTALSILKLLPEKTGFIEQGNMVFNGIELKDLNDIKMQAIRGKKISMIFQDPMTSLNPVLTIEYQIREVLELHNKRKGDINKRVDDILTLVGIPTERKYEYPHQFSGGMKQRVIIAIALACEPDLLIADEPTTALDVTIQAQVLDMMDNLKEKLNTSMILITHDLGIVAQTCDYVAIMYAGEIVEYGLLEDIFDFDKNHHPYTVGLFGSIPKIGDESRRLNPIYGLMPDPMDLPKGCKFHPRCLQRLDKCDKEAPNDIVNGKHRIKCHLFI